MGCKNYTIRNFYRWTSETWKMNIHIKKLKQSKGVAQKVITPTPYQKIAFIYPHQRDKWIARKFIDKLHRTKETLDR